MKALLWIALILFIAGGVLFGGAIVYNGGFDFSDNYVTTTLTVEENFTSLFAEIDESDLTVLPATDGKCTAVFYEHKDRPHTIAVRDETLIIGSKEKDISHYIFSLFDFGKPKITLYLPKNAYDALHIEADTGDIRVDKAFQFERAEIETDTGDIRMNASVNGPAILEADTGNIFAEGATLQSLEASTDTGNITLKSIRAAAGVMIETDTGHLSIDALSAKSLSTEGGTAKQDLKNLTVEDSIRMRNSTGDIKIEGARADLITASLSTGDIHFENCIFTSSLEARTTTGDVTFTDTDAPLITVNATTGDVSGTLLSGKEFDAKSKTGRVTIPENDPTGGKCKISVNTGRITISIK